MATFSNQYIEPGIYIESEITPTPVLGAVGNFVPILIGTPDVYKKVVSDSLSLPAAGKVILSYSGTSVLYNDVATTSEYTGETYIIDSLNRKYVYGADKDFVILEGSGEDEGKAIVEWKNTSVRPYGNFKVYFFMKKSVSEYEEPVFFYAAERAKAIDFIGKIRFDSNNTLKYTLPLGISLAFANGASGVWCISSTKISGIKKDIGDILDQIVALKNPDNTYPYSIVYLEGFVDGVSSGLSTDDATAIVNFVRRMSSILEQRECIAIFGPVKGTDALSNAESLYSNTLALLKDRRIIYCRPSDIVITVNGYEYTVDGVFLAAALAGLIDSVAINLPLTGQLISGITKEIDPFLRSVKNNLAASGCLIVEDSAIRHALTTDQTNAITGEVKITRLIDYIIRILRSSLKQFVNQPFSPSLLSTIAMSVKLILTQLTSIGAIIDYRDINVERNTAEPRQVDVSFVVRPSFDVNWIHVKFVIES